jgi:hypothetical protein
VTPKALPAPATHAHDLPSEGSKNEPEPTGEARHETGRAWK